MAVASREELVAAALHDSRVPMKPRRPRLVFDANGHAISLASSNPRYGSLLAQADIVHADGGFLITMSRIFAARKIPERTATTDLIHDLAEAEGGGGLSFYLLGGSEEVNRQTAETLKRMHPQLRIVGRHHGYLSPEGEHAVIADINAAAPDVLWVGMGKPLEQEFCVRNRDKLDVAWAVTCGGCFHYVTGDYKRAPRWMQKANLEWLHRVSTNPRRLFLRYLRTSPHALFLTITRSDRLRTRVLDRGKRPDASAA